ncbi:MAG: bifunctional phosphoribosylaminoimidazolecarboxamide formyltransferase/IMP cyclohydrolase [Bdellovibrionales bacterium]|nr:bifunctional phosphoribosylaminoimidazolecarboxamide formyltransferase/IMP cyclohydrolase [Bdellovibrionales bacterium]
MSYAFFSVTDKTGIEVLAKEFVAKGIQLVSTGGTRKYLLDHGFTVLPIEKITNKPEAFQGRMKSISFEMASGILFRRQDPNDLKEAADLQIPQIDYVVINFYPFAKKQSEGLSFDELVDYIDIGGPSLLRAAAKNFESVTVLSNVNQYEDCVRQLQQEGRTSIGYRKTLAKEAFLLTAKYDQAISDRFIREDKGDLRYGENPHQSAVANVDTTYWNLLMDNKEMSYNNYLDSHHAWLAALDLHKEYQDKSGVVVVKHNNPCGFAVHGSASRALELAWEGDPVSAFGSVVAVNTEVNAEVALFLKDKFIEIIIAPTYSEDAMQILKSKNNLRILQAPLAFPNHQQRTTVIAGELVQNFDTKTNWEIEWKTKNKITSKENLLRFSFLAAKHLKSNAIVLAREVDDGLQMVGAGMGQPNRIDCIKRLAIPRMKEYFSEIKMNEVVLASDAFFPFADSIDICKEYGITTIIQPGGSIRDKDVIAAADAAGIAMAMTATRHFKH